MSSYIALDIGDKRIGVSICDSSAPFPAPLTTLHASSGVGAELMDILSKQKVSAIIIGYPRNQAGEATDQTARVEKIVGLLNLPGHIPIYWQDESLTSVKAEAELSKRGKPFSKGDIDSLAATYILDDFIKSHPNFTPRSNNIEEHTIRSESDVTSKKKAKIKTKTRSIRYFFIAFLLILSILLMSIFVWYKKSISPKSNVEKYQIVEIKPGSSAASIAQKLESADLIRSTLAFGLYMKLNPDSNLKAGSYRLSANMSVEQIISVISGGDVVTKSILIAPGLRYDQIVENLKKQGYSSDGIRLAEDKLREHELLNGLVGSSMPEGYLFPDTYVVEPGGTAEELYIQIAKNFQSKISSEIKSGLKKQGLSFREAVILASIVQKEEPNASTQKTIAQVFLKRYREGVPLGADPTFKYAAAQFGDINSPDSNSPYNTRKVVGLPPTAIANFNISALEAVANPASSDFMYFVHGDDGKAYFSKTLHEHEQNTAKFCTIACR
jgi:UPF0755 protein